LPFFKSFEAPRAAGAVSIGEGARFQAFEVPLVTVQQAGLHKGVRLSCPKRGASVVRRRFWAVALVLGLVLGAALPLGFLFSGSAPVAAGREFRPSMRVPAGVDADGDRVDDRLGSEIAQRGLNGTQGEPANVIVMLNGETGEAAAAAFAASGGSVTTGLWKYALYGFGGRIPYGKIRAFVNSRSDVLLFENESIAPVI
jgi:hypothetical protein